MMTDTMNKYGRTFVRTKDGGWLEAGATLPNGSTARIFGDAIILKRAARNMYAGTFWGGEFRGGMFWGGEFWGGTFWGGAFWGGEFWGGEFRGGMFRDGEFRSGMFWGGEFWASPAAAQRSDGYMFVAHFVDNELRIWAGCRDFSWDEAVSHWNDGHKHGAESQRIINFLKEQAEAARDLRNGADK